MSTEAKQISVDEIEKTEGDVTNVLSSPSEKKEGVIVFGKPFEFEGKSVESIDLSGLENLTGDDLLEADRAYSATGNYSPVPELTLAYAFSLAATVAGVPHEFFKRLPGKEALKVKNEVVRFLNS
jgi:hypothetical protein